MVQTTYWKWAWWNTWLRNIEEFVQPHTCVCAVNYHAGELCDLQYISVIRFFAKKCLFNTWRHTCGINPTKGHVCKCSLLFLLNMNFDFTFLRAEAKSSVFFHYTDKWVEIRKSKCECQAKDSTVCTVYLRSKDSDVIWCVWCAVKNLSILWNLVVEFNRNKIIVHVYCRMTKSVTLSTIKAFLR